MPRTLQPSGSRVEKKASLTRNNYPTCEPQTETLWNTRNDRRAWLNSSSPHTNSAPQVSSPHSLKDTISQKFNGSLPQLKSGRRAPDGSYSFDLTAPRLIEQLCSSLYMWSKRCFDQSKPLTGTNDMSLECRVIPNSVFKLLTPQKHYVTDLSVTTRLLFRSRCINLVSCMFPLPSKKT